jgi:Tfp pilus assembly protein PilF
MTPVRAVAALVLTTALAWLGWLVLQTTRADQLANIDPQGALRIDADHPRGLRLRALQQLAAGDDSGATATASHLLRVAPGRGDGFAIIALAASRNARPDARALLEIAARRAPRITQVRAQLAALQLQSGDLPDAMAQIDALLRVDPKQGAKFFPAMVQQSAVPAFADAMAVTLEAIPPWRSTFLAA